MNWFFLALACALFTACCDALSKKAMQQIDEWTAGAVVMGIAGLVLAPVFFSCDLKPVSLEPALLYAVTMPFEILAYYLFLSAIRMAPLSLTVPLLAFTPALTIVSSYVILGEEISLWGGLGICLVTVGAYIVNGNVMNQHILAPVRAIFSNSGSRRMLAVAFIWALTSALGKKGYLLYGAIPYGYLILMGNVAVFGLMATYKFCKGPTCVRPDAGALAIFLVAGLLMAGAEITHFLAMSLAPAAYMISVKRLSLVLGVIIGWLFFGERNISYRLVGACVMVTGVFLIH
jgi:drug/metabolite transporter (DMT)-like permease